MDGKKLTDTNEAPTHLREQAVKFVAERLLVLKNLLIV